jgi:hypothetical protein
MTILNQHHAALAAKLNAPHQQTIPQLSPEDRALIERRIAELEAADRAMSLLVDPLGTPRSIKVEGHNSRSFGLGLVRGASRVGDELSHLRELLRTIDERAAWHATTLPSRVRHRQPNAEMTSLDDVLIASGDGYLPTPPLRVTGEDGVDESWTLRAVGFLSPSEWQRVKPAFEAERERRLDVFRIEVRNRHARRHVDAARSRYLSSDDVRASVNEVLERFGPHAAELERQRIADEHRAQWSTEAREATAAAAAAEIEREMPRWSRKVDHDFGFAVEGDDRWQSLEIFRRIRNSDLGSRPEEVATTMIERARDLVYRVACWRLGDGTYLEREYGRRSGNTPFDLSVERIVQRIDAWRAEAA